MDEFPFTHADWQRVTDVSLGVTNACLADDTVLHASQVAELVAVLEELRQRYGEHPILLETEADFLQDTPLKLDLYRSAIRLAEQHALPTYIIRISLAYLLLDVLADPKEAEKELIACHSELSLHADESEKKEWSELMGRCEKLRPGQPARKKG